MITVTQIPDFKQSNPENQTLPSAYIVLNLFIKAEVLTSQNYYPKSIVLLQEH